MAPPLLLIGAGAAGVSAALWLRDLHQPFAWFEAADRLGGTLHQVHNPIHQHLGQRWERGAALVAAMEAQLAAAKLSPTFGRRVLRLDAPSPDAPVEVTWADTNASPQREAFAGVIVATGTQRRWLGLGEEDHVGRGVALSGRAERGRFAGLDVVIVGGGDAAVENALLLAEVARSVTLVHRSPRFRARADLFAQASAHPRVQLLTEAALTRVLAAPGAPLLEAVEVEVRGQRRRLEAQGLLVRIGVEAHLPAHALQTWDAGYLWVDAQGRSSHPRIFGAGDCACPGLRAVAVAAGQGAAAAHAATHLDSGAPPRSC
jgi:thioredoxin reductase (NADPH)